MAEDAERETYMETEGGTRRRQNDPEVQLHVCTIIFMIRRDDTNVYDVRNVRCTVLFSFMNAHSWGITYISVALQNVINQKENTEVKQKLI